MFSRDKLCSFSRRRIWKTYHETKLGNKQIFPDLALLFPIKRQVEQCGAIELMSRAGAESRN